MNMFSYVYGILRMNLCTSTTVEDCSILHIWQQQRQGREA